VDRATASAQELSAKELLAGAQRLKKKVARHRPRCVAFVGVTAYRTAFGRKSAVLGPQAEKIGNSSISVLPNPSVLKAHFRLEDFVRFTRELRQTVESDE